jgi:hypothetical protein
VAPTSPNTEGGLGEALLAGRSHKFKGREPGRRGANRVITMPVYLFREIMSVDATKLPTKMSLKKRKSHAHPSFRCHPSKSCRGAGRVKRTSESGQPLRHRRKSKGG